MLKKCSRCKQELDVKEFCVHRGNKDGLNDFCKNCNKAYHKEHYKKNREKYLEKERLRRLELGEWLKGLKRDLKCELCGEDHPATLDFHHKDPAEKDFNVATMTKGYSKEKILEEIAKCHVWCSNCHRKHHWEEKQMARSASG